MSHSREEYRVKRVAFFVPDAREWREKRDWSEASFVRVAHVAPFSHMSCERRDARYEIRGQVPC